MQIDPRDDFRAFGDPGAHFYGLLEPFLFMRDGLERELQAQIADTVLDRIEVVGAPKIITLETEEDPPRLVHVAVCFPALLWATYDEGKKRERMAVTATFLYGPMGPRAVRRVHVDFHQDAGPAFDDERVAERLARFSADVTG